MQCFFYALIFLDVKHVDLHYTLLFKNNLFLRAWASYFLRIKNNLSHFVKFRTKKKHFSLK